MNIEEITINNEKYPNKLKMIYDPPLKIYAIGNTKILKEKNIAIVGTRKASQYGKKIAYKLAKELSEKRNKYS